MLTAITKNLQWAVIPSLVLVVFFALLLAFSYFQGNISFNVGNYAYSTFTTTGYSELSGSDTAAVSNTPAEDEARIKAFNDAKSKAEKLAQVSNKRLGKLVSINEYVESTPPPLTPSLTPDSLSVPSESTDSNKLRMTVSLTYELK